MGKFLFMIFVLVIFLFAMLVFSKLLPLGKRMTEEEKKKLFDDGIKKLAKEKELKK